MPRACTAFNPQRILVAVVGASRVEVLCVSLYIWFEDLATHAQQLLLEDDCTPKLIHIRGFGFAHASQLENFLVQVMDTPI